MPSKPQRDEPKRRRGVRLRNPVQITEDEADLIISMRRLEEPTITFEEYLERRGYELIDEEE